eukprot:SAG31_NODE_5065_length_2763_cov_1.794670_4_plen_237_part_00
MERDAEPEPSEPHPPSQAEIAIDPATATGVDPDGSAAQAALAGSERERKTCGHDCFPGENLKCCACMDIRPVLQGDTYPIYVDGQGWLDVGARDQHCALHRSQHHRLPVVLHCVICLFVLLSIHVCLCRILEDCPICNPNNFVQWERKMRTELEKIAAEKARQAVETEQGILQAQADKARAAEEGNTSGRSTVFTYSNGDVYEGEMLNGEPHGFGKMCYADDELSNRLETSCTTCA